MRAPASVAPRFAVRLSAAVMAYLVLWGGVRVATSASVPAVVGLLLLCGAFLVARRGRGRFDAGLAGALALVGVGAEWVAHDGALSTGDVWATSAVACVALLLLWRGQHLVAWVTMLALCALLGAVGGLRVLQELGVLTTVLALAVIAAAGRVVGWYAVQMEHYAAAEHEALEWRVAQDAYQTAHQQRIEQTGRLADAMLQRIVAADGRLDAAERHECRLLHQAIRDETRGRLLLNDAVREQVRLHRRRGAAVQLFDDGRLGAVDPAALARVQDAVAASIAPLTSDRIVIRSGTQQGVDVVTVVATTVDPIAAALGQDDDEQVDLWQEFPLSPAALTTADR